MAIPPSPGRAALALAACAALASARPCSLWQIIDPEVSKFNTVRGNLNGYGLDLKGGFEPVIRGKILQTFDSTCPTSMSALDSIGFTLSSSASEPILVDYAEIKVGPAKISLSGLRGAMEAHHFEASVAQCGPDENYGGPCFGGTVSLHALTGNAHVLSHDIDLTGQTGQVEVRGYLEPDEEELRLQFTTMHINYQVSQAARRGAVADRVDSRRERAPLPGAPLTLPKRARAPAGCAARASSPAD